MSGESCYRTPSLDEIRAMISLCERHRVPSLDEIRTMISLCERHMQKCERGPLSLRDLHRRITLIRMFLVEIVGAAPHNSPELARGVELYWRFSRWVIV